MQSVEMGNQVASAGGRFVPGYGPVMPKGPGLWERLCNAWRALQGREVCMVLPPYNEVPFSSGDMLLFEVNGSVQGGALTRLQEGLHEWMKSGKEAKLWVVCGSVTIKWLRREGRLAGGAPVSVSAQCD